MATILFWDYESGNICGGSPNVMPPKYAVLNVFFNHKKLILESF